jgi:hypothetical protein
MAAAALHESSDVHVRVPVAVGASVDKALRWSLTGGDGRVHHEEPEEAVWHCQR